MPFKSKAQARFLFARHPKIAKEFATKTKNIKSLPEHIKKNKSKKGLKVGSPRNQHLKKALNNLK